MVKNSGIRKFVITMLVVFMIIAVVAASHMDHRIRIVLLVATNGPCFVPTPECYQQCALDSTVPDLSAIHNCTFSCTNFSSYDVDKAASCRDSCLEGCKKNN
ncbi:hypothetical protein Q3G72_022679 [Acer saccharum]|nr:hypothetical protein Q3G72_022679 [Acer saccharum]